jgi:NADPH:quinone reductase-like Zn-dependent oxidoreductase
MPITSARVVVAARRGGPEVLTLRDVDLQPPSAGELQLRVTAAGVAFGDQLLREGLVPGSGPSPVPGYDVVGVVEQVGAGSAFASGDRVAAFTGGTGGYASRALVRSELATPVPADLPDDVAVATVLDHSTAWQMLTRVTAVGEGGTVLVHGATGAVGRALVELAHLRGLRVIGTASAQRLDRLAQTGATAIERAGDWTGQVRRAAPQGLDAVFDGVGGPVGRRSFGLLGAGGTLVQYGATGGLRAGRRNLVGLGTTALGGLRTSALGLFMGGVGVHGHVSTRFVPAHPAWFRDDLDELLRLAAAGTIRPRVAVRMPLEEAAEAHRLLGRGTDGKIVLSAAP